MIYKNLYPGGKKRAVTFSYDDGVLEDIRLIEILNKYGLKGTFHLNSGLMENSERTVKLCDIASVYAGHEISCHSLTHPSLVYCHGEEIIRQIIEDRRNLEKYAGYIVRGMSYPNGSVNDKVVDILGDCGIAYSRTTVATNKFTLPENYLRWHPTCHHDGGIMEKIEPFSRFYHPLPCFYVWGHACEFPRNNNWNLIEDFAREISGIEDAWFATNIEIYNYATALDRLVFGIDGMVHNPSAIPVWVSDDGIEVEIKPGETYIGRK